MAQVLAPANLKAQRANQDAIAEQLAVVERRTEDVGSLRSHRHAAAYEGADQDLERRIKKAEEAQAEAAAALESYNTQLAEARLEAGRIKDQARADAAKIEADLKARATEDAERITAQAQQRIEQERQAAFSSLKSEVGTLAIDLSEKVVGESMDDARSAAIVDRFLAELEASEAAK